MEKRAIISVKSFSDIDPNEAIEVVTPGTFIIQDLRLYMKNQKYQEWMARQLH